MIIGVSGAAGAGKDSVGKILIEEYGFRRLALGDKVKEAALALDPIVDVQTVDEHPVPVRLSDLIDRVGPEKAKEWPEVRRTYQRMGTEVGRRTLDEEIWVKLLFALIPNVSKQDFVITDVRFLNEARAVTRRKGFMVRVIRPGAGLEGEAALHVSETELSDGSDGIFDEIVHNDGTLEDLSKKVAEFVAVFGSGI